MRIASFVLGTVLTLGILLAVVQAMLVPRGSHSIVARSVNRVVSSAADLPLSWFRSYDAQDRWLAGAAPVTLLLQLVVYVAMLIGSMGLVMFGMTKLDLVDSMYQSGSTLTTLGIVQPITDASAIATFVAAFFGLVLIAIFIGYLMALYSSFVERESQTASLSLVSGEPAWGPEILARSKFLGVEDGLALDNNDWISWTCDLRLNLHVNPVLANFRSTTSNCHWAVSLLAVLDATALRLALDGEKPDAGAIRLLAEGSITFVELAERQGHRVHTLQLERKLIAAIGGTAPEGADPCIDHDDWLVAINELRAANVELPADLDRAEQTFLAIRSLYASSAQEVASRFHAVRSPWTGDRSPSVPVVWPELIGDSANS